MRWPGFVDVMLFPAGTFFRALDNVVTFGVQYPLEKAQRNQYSHAFLEDSLLVGKRCYDSKVVRVPLCVNGAVGAREQITCTYTGMATLTKTITIGGSASPGTTVHPPAAPTPRSTTRPAPTKSQPHA